MEYETKDSRIKEVLLLSNDSGEYYLIEVFIVKSKYEENKMEIESIIHSFEKQL